MKKIIVIIVGVLGLVFVAMAFYYWLTPANSLLHFMPGYNPNSSAVHFKHGLASLILGLLSFIYLWFNGNKKSV